MNRLKFNSRVLITGFGAVAQAALPMLLQHVRIPLGSIAVIDFADRRDVLRPWMARGLQFVQERVTPANLARLVSAHVNRGGLIIDLAWSTDFFEIVDWARNNDVLYVNASLESWDPSAELHAKSLIEKTLYSRYLRVLEIAPKWRGAATALLDQGANPGLISYFVKQGLLDIGARAVRAKDLARAQRRRLERLLSEQDFPELGRALGVKTIHCSELDTQHSARPKRSDEFVNTWSVEGLWEECIAPCEFGWGTHEKSLPPMAIKPRIGPGNQIILPQMGMNTWVRSRLPRQDIVGMAITHGELFGISRALTIQEGRRVVYRPTVIYVYLPSNDSMLSLHELRCRNYELHPRKRMLVDDIAGAGDSTGPFCWVTVTSRAEPARSSPSHTHARATHMRTPRPSRTRRASSLQSDGICRIRAAGSASRRTRHATSACGMPATTTGVCCPSRRAGRRSGYRAHFEENPDAGPHRGDPRQSSNFLCPLWALEPIRAQDLEHELYRPAGRATQAE